MLHLTTSLFVAVLRCSRDGNLIMVMIIRIRINKNKNKKVETFPLNSLRLNLKLKDHNTWNGKVKLKYEKCLFISGNKRYPSLCVKRKVAEC